MDDGNFHISAEPHVTSTDEDYDMKVMTAVKAEHIQELKNWLKTPLRRIATEKNA